MNTWLLLHPLFHRRAARLRFIPPVGFAAEIHSVCLAKRKDVLLLRMTPLAGLDGTAHKVGECNQQSRRCRNQCKANWGRNERGGYPYLAVIFEGISCGREVRDGLLTVWAPWARRDRVSHVSEDWQSRGHSGTLDSPFPEPHILLTLSGFIC